MSHYGDDDIKEPLSLKQVLRDHWRDSRMGPKKNLKEDLFFSEKGIGIPGVVGCNGEFHGIYFNTNGAVSFKNHNVKELHNAVTMDKLANKLLKDSSLTGCALILRGLMDIPRDFQGFSPGVRYTYSISAIAHMLDELKKIGVARKKIRDVIEANESSGKLDNLCRIATTEINKYVIPKLKYRGATHPFGAPKEVTNGIEYKLNLVTNSIQSVQAVGSLFLGKKKFRRDPQPQWAIFEATLNLPWYVKVFKKGLAVINEMLVLDIVKSFPNNTLLLKVARQGYGFTVNTVHAIYDPSREHLSWVMNEAKVNTLEETDKVPRRRRTKAEIQERKVK
jgi:hypothetical protein